MRVRQRPSKTLLTPGTRVYNKHLCTQLEVLMTEDALDPYDDDPILEAIRSLFCSTDAAATANHPFLEFFREDPNIATICGLSDFLFEVSHSSPCDIDRVLLVVCHAEADESLLTVYWSPERPAATFGDVFYVDFGDKVWVYLEEGPSDRQTFLAASLLSGHSKGLHVLSSPSSAAAITDGLKLSNYFEWNNDIASTGVAGACLQLLGGYIDLPDPLEKVLEALKRLSISREDELLLKVPPIRLHLFL